MGGKGTTLCLVPQSIFWDGGLLESVLGNSCKRMKEQICPERVAVCWQKMPESNLQEALYLKWPFRVVPNQSKEVGVWPSLNQSFCDDWLWEGGRILSKATSFSLRIYLELDPAVGYKEPTLFTAVGMSVLILNGDAGGLSQHALEPNPVFLRSLWFIS